MFSDATPRVLVWQEYIVLNISFSLTLPMYSGRKATEETVATYSA